MNLLKSILILSATANVNLPPTLTPPSERRKSNARTALLCDKCTGLMHEQSSSPQTRRRHQDARDICSKEVSPSLLRWVLDEHDKKEVISRSKQKLNLFL